MVLGTATKDDNVPGTDCRASRMHQRIVVAEPQTFETANTISNSTGDHASLPQG